MFLQKQATNSLCMNFRKRFNKVHLLYVITYDVIFYLSIKKYLTIHDLGSM
ncbi:hypothetical protein D1BOALGB6SA_2287 [Olavius sp. associated proteobacterium Delta 1]|nr:hypothetical protein D1BOALGB6SA_2287 [Olavius sp. associated proteobacterium Delta 1]